MSTCGVRLLICRLTWFQLKSTIVCNILFIDTCPNIPKIIPQTIHTVIVCDNQTNNCLIQLHFSCLVNPNFPIQKTRAKKIDPKYNYFTAFILLSKPFAYKFHINDKKNHHINVLYILL